MRKSQVKLIWRHPYVVKTIKWRNLISKSPQVWLKKTLANPKVGGTPGTFSRHQDWKSLIYAVYEGFRQTLLGYGGLVLGPSQFQVKKSVVHFKSDLKVIILLHLPRYFPPWFSQNPWYALCIILGSISVKRYWQLDWVLTLLESARIKAVRRTLMKLTPVIPL